MKLFELGERTAQVHEVLVTVGELAERDDARAVLLESADDPALLRPYLNRLDLVVLRFPIFRDGRGFTQARELREYLRFSGEIRAEGHILPDQAAFLRRCGVDSVVLPKNGNGDPALWEKQLRQFPVAYQRSVLLERSVGPGLRVEEAS
ncbi:DUF934 domain-containing protein [Gluconobacter sphaericus]|jgi:uncharacterized protein (DUF934 family)|uniref:Oxidoreductase n=1 Tax=Gluconobacter sphaericus NBRC 12467 TaxID=1307951 RepID=A0AA37SHW2_9PROT|nr:DUF934 domain-containing protein [Gluconobacter sphaericus]MBF0885932.1 DUF934 domain-containing protein [Gluconobacter sphaericus]QQX92189.1 DUF934 domain-containing protein [Gluconobacter sphaericus]GBR50037.1 hypothetical protein AA12467_0113 [Gluconobacter sphaericus NBRC 12467]GEB42533.1 hypothetical protein GSP01_13150 [Gluconobacter sphaericus NBRC 12467]GLQ85555.1 hypothetical protein GCM10007872_24650 [Gluconobacter sphaericus NBRC 12467]